MAGVFVEMEGQQRK